MLPDVHHTLSLIRIESQAEVPLKGPVRMLRRIRIAPSQIAFKNLVRKHTCHHLASARDEPILPLPNMAHQKRALLHMAGSPTAQRFVAAQS